MSVKDIDETAAAVAGQFVRKEPHTRAHTACNNEAFSPRRCTGIENFPFIRDFKGLGC
jgi:hypothetical protein